MPSSHAHRILRFEGAKNVRDLGGLPTRNGGRTGHGVLYRADGLSRLTDADLERVAELGLKTIIDLRYDEERARAPDRVPPGAAPAFFHRGFMPQGTRELFDSINVRGADANAAFALMCSNYIRMPFEHAAEFRDVMHHLLAPTRSPCLIHCTSGKDRTGIAVAFILRAIDVDIADVLIDYELSNGEFQPVEAFASGARPEAVAIVMAARPEYLQAAFDAIDERCGSFDAYAEALLGFGARERAALASLLLE